MSSAVRGCDAAVFFLRLLIEPGRGLPILPAVVKSSPVGIGRWPGLPSASRLGGWFSLSSGHIYLSKDGTRSEVGCMLRSMIPQLIPSSGWNTPPPTWKDFWDIAAHIAQVVGFTVGGVWAYFNFVKSRTYHPRMELSVSGELRSIGNQQYLVPRVTLKNIGNSKISLPNNIAGYRIWIAKDDVDETGELRWSDGGKVAYAIFEDHDWIEPGELIFDELRMFAIPSDCVAAKVHARLEAPVGWFRKNTTWNCSTIVGPPLEKEKKQ
jgi:hypothetical protein